MRKHYDNQYAIEQERRSLKNKFAIHENIAINEYSKHGVNV